MTRNLQQLSDRKSIALLAGGDRTTRLSLRNDPLSLMESIASVHSRGDLPVPVLARALDETLSFISDAEEAREMLNDHFSPEVQAEFTASHSDLFSCVIQIADPEVVLSALEFDVGSMKYASTSGITITVGLLLRAWAANLKERDDWDEILEMEIANTSLRRLLVASVHFDADESVTDDVWVQVGLDPHQADEIFSEMLEEGTLPKYSDLDVAKAQRRLRELRQTFESSSTEALAELEKLVDELDI